MSTTISVRLPDNVAARLKEMAKRECRSVSETIMWILKKYEEREETFEKYYERNKSFIEHSRAQEGKALSIEEVFGD